ncbi:MAG: glycosyltransferase family 39 protein [Ruminococcus flavefaciens]|nr:glycosyltransferase family 39 protein [Ruminococcus flavefaciens]
MVKKIRSKYRNIIKKRFIMNFSVLDRLLSVICIIIAALMFFRVLFGIDITDESYYYADALAAVRGNLPYAFNTSNACGMTIIMAPFAYIYQLLVPSLEGYFLYMRVCFVVFQMVILGIVYFQLKPLIGRTPVLLAMISFIAYYGHIQSFGYNNSSFFSIFCSCALIYSAILNSEGNRNERKLFFAGVMSAIGVLSHPLYAPSIVVLFFLLLFYSDRKSKIKNVIFYSIGGISEICVVFISIIAQVGVKSFLIGMDVLLFHRLHFKKVEKALIFRDMFLTFKPLWLMLLLVFLCVYVILACWEKISHSETNVKNKSMEALSIGIIVDVIYIGLKVDSNIPCHLGIVSLLVFVILAVICRDRLIFIFGMPYVSFFICECMFTSTGNVLGRSQYAYPIMFAAICLLYKMEKNDIKVTSILIGVSLAVVLVRSDYQYAYGDAATNMLTYQVPQGIYKGVFTEKDNAVNIMEVEEYIKKNTSPNEKISFRDNVPFAYLMSEGEMWDIRTWDAMQYTYSKAFEVNDPANLYIYYYNRGDIPDKYIYIDFGRDEFLSLEDTTWKFNRWIESYYTLVSEDIINEQFSAKIYINNGEFNNDFEKWIERYNELLIFR